MFTMKEVNSTEMDDIIQVEYNECSKQNTWERIALLLFWVNIDACIKVYDGLSIIKSYSLSKQAQAWFKMFFSRANKWDLFVITTKLYISWEKLYWVQLCLWEEKNIRPTITCRNVWYLILEYKQQIIKRILKRHITLAHKYVFCLRECR